MSKAQFYTPPIPEPVKASEGRFVPNRMEKDAVMRRVSRDLYASETAGLRELLANEITAARVAKRLGANPRIEVTLLDDRIMVWGIESLGMERRIFNEIYTVLGRSGNFDATTPGQFGLGRAAYVTISDHMLLETRHRNGDKYTVLGVEGRGFQVDMDEPDIPYGTRITMAPREGRVTYTMKRLVEKIAGRCDIPITLITESGTERLERQPLHVYGSAITADLPDAEISVGTGGADGAFLCGMPIGFVYRGHYDVSVAVDIHDERKYPPTPDRERMTEEAEYAISAVIDAEIASRLADFPDDINEALSHPNRSIAYHLHMAPRPLYFGVMARGPHGDVEAELGELAGGPFMACHAYVGRMIDAVRAVHPNAVFVKKAPGGLITISEFMKAHGIRSLPPKKAGQGRPGLVTVHTSSGPKKVDPANPPEDTVVLRVADGTKLNEYRHLLHNRIVLTIYDVDGAVDADSFIADARSRTFTTSSGTMTGGELIDSGETIRRTARRAIVDGWKNIRIPRATGIAVWDDGTGMHAESYDMLWRIHGRVELKLNIKKWEWESVVEAFMALQHPTLRRVLAECPETRRADVCDDFLVMDGKPSVAHDMDCWCPKCARQAA